MLKNAGGGGLARGVSKDMFMPARFTPKVKLGRFDFQLSLVVQVGARFYMSRPEREQGSRKLVAFLSAEQR